MRNIKPLISLFMILLLAGLGEVYAQNAPVSGTHIKNQAYTTFKVNGIADAYEIASNEVEVVVEESFSFNLEIQNYLQRFRGDNVTFNH